MKVTVKDTFLNVRVGKPSVNAPCYQYIAPGSIIEVDGNLYKGDKYGDSGIDTWLKDEAGNYYWSGGVSGAIALESIHYSDFLKGIDSSIINSKGQNITLIIIDDGIVFKSPFFDVSKSKSINIDNSPVDSAHGTFIGGIVAGANEISGIANEGNIISIKYKSDSTALENLLDNLITALKIATDIQGPVVINLSQGFSDFSLEKNIEQKNQIIDCVKNFVKGEDKFIVCSAGDNGLLSENLLFPSYLEECISVGCLNEFHKDTNVSKKLKILSPQVEFTSFDLKFMKTKDTGSSYATAMMSSIIACVLSAGKTTGTTFTVPQMISRLHNYSVERIAFKYDELRQFQFDLV